MKCLVNLISGTTRFAALPLLLQSLITVDAGRPNQKLRELLFLSVVSNEVVSKMLGPLYKNQSSC
jgi:hypothetical protein